MISIAEKHQKTVAEAIAQLISRAENSRRVADQRFVGANFKSLEKYLWRDNENASSSEIKEFIAEIRADDLCLIIACENGDRSGVE